MEQLGNTVYAKELQFVDDELDMQVNIYSPYRPTYQCLTLEGICVRRGSTYGMPLQLGLTLPFQDKIAPVQMHANLSNCLDTCRRVAIEEM